MSTAVVGVSAGTPAPVPKPAPAPARLAVRLVVRALAGVVLLGLAALGVGPRLFPIQGFYVRSASMAPAIPVGALVIATRAPAEVLRPGDVIIFERPDTDGMMVVHRIHAVEETPAGRAFITKGDANAAPDGWQVEATGEGWRAVHSLPGAGFLVGGLQAAFGRRGWLGAVAAVVAVYALVTIWRSETP